MSVPMAVGLVAGLVNLWALVDVWCHPRGQWPPTGGNRAMWFFLALAGLSCAASTAPFLVPVAVYTAIAYLGAVHPRLKEGVQAA